MAPPPLVLVAFLALGPFVPGPAQEGENTSSPGEPYGRWLGTIGGLAQPSAVAVDAQGRVWIAEAFADRVRAFDSEGEEVAHLGKAGELRSPGGLAIAPDGTVFVADSGNQRIQAFAPDGSFLRTMGSWTLTPHGLNEPLGMALDDERLYVADSRNDRIVSFSHAGRPLASIGGPGRDEGRFHEPVAVAVDDEGFLYVADSGNHRVQKLDHEGRCVKAWGDFGPWPGFFSDPTGIAWHDGLVYVADRENHRVQVFSDDGELAYDFGIHALLPREGDGKVHYPDHIALAADGSFLALAESFEDRVQLFARWPAGEAPEPDPLRFERDQSSHYGGGISIGGGYMALVEPSAPSLILWDLELDEPIQVCRHRSYGSRVGQLARPSDAAIDPERNLVHVADPGNRRIATYSYTPRGPDEPLKYDPFLLKLVRAVDLDALDWQGLPGPRVRIGPEALAIAPDGGLLVVDVRQCGLYRFGPELEYVGALSPVDPPLRRPVDVAFDREGRVLVVDQLARHVRVLVPATGDEATRELDPIGGPEQELGGLLRPAGIEVLADGRVWVSDMARHRIVEFGPDGASPRTIGAPGVRRVEFHKPRGIAQDGRGRIFVLDWGNHRGQILTDEGEYLDSFGARFFTRPARLQKDVPQAEPPERPAPGRPVRALGFLPRVTPPAGPWDDAEHVLSNGAGYLVCFRTDPSPIPENETFSVSAWVFDPERPDAPLDDVALDVDAEMPEHGHGMTRVPEITRRADGGFDASGLLFHMVGRWELYLDVTRGPITERAQRSLVQ